MEFNISMAKEELKNITTQYLQKDGDGNYKVDVWQRLPIFIQGPAGVGKTQIVGEVAQEKGIGFVSYSLVHHTRQSMMGLPVIRSFSYEGKEKKYTEYTLSEILGAVYKMKEKGAEEGILFLDEANCCPESIQPILLSFLQSKTLGNAKLPDGWIIVLCGNPPRSIYNKNARNWDAVLLDRLRIINIKIDNEEYLKYISKRGFHLSVQYYLSLHPEDTYICEDKTDTFQLVTYRTWENLSNALFDYERLDLPVTPMMINEYIKADDVLLKFYEVYRYSQVDSESYKEASEWIIQKENYINVAAKLKKMPGIIVYGIMNAAFKKLSEQADKAMKKQKFLQKFKSNILKQEYSVNAYETEYIPEEIKIELETLWNTVAYEELYDEYKKVFDRTVRQLNTEKEGLIQKVENMLLILEKMGNKVLLQFYLRIVLGKVEWIYVNRTTKHKEIDRLEKKLQMNNEAVA